MTLATIKKAIKKLPDRKRTSLTAWLVAMDRQVWDAELERDFSKGGRGMKLNEKVARRSKNLL